MKQHTPAYMEALHSPEGRTVYCEVCRRLVPFFHCVHDQKTEDALPWAERP
jgi:hypothetical protein